MTAPKEDETSGNIKSYHGTPLMIAEYNALMELEQFIHNPISLVSEWNSNIFGVLSATISPVTVIGQEATFLTLSMTSVLPVNNSS